MDGYRILHVCPSAFLRKGGGQKTDLAEIRTNSRYHASHGYVIVRKQSENLKHFRNSQSIELQYTGAINSKVKNLRTHSSVYMHVLFTGKS